MIITTSADLKTAIERLKNKNEDQKILIKQDFNAAIQSLTPSGLLKSAAKNIAAHPDIATSAVGTTLAVGAGVLSKKIIMGGSKNIFKNLLGTAVEFAVIGGFRKNAELIAGIGLKLLKKKF